MPSPQLSSAHAPISPHHRTKPPRERENSHPRQHPEKKQSNTPTQYILPHPTPAGITFPNRIQHTPPAPTPTRDQRRRRRPRRPVPEGAAEKVVAFSWRFRSRGCGMWYVVCGMWYRSQFLSGLGTGSRSGLREREGGGGLGCGRARGGVWSSLGV